MQVNYHQKPKETNLIATNNCVKTSGLNMCLHWSIHCNNSKPINCDL